MIKYIKVNSKGSGIETIRKKNDKIKFERTTEIKKLASVLTENNDIMSKIKHRHTTRNRTFFGLVRTKI